MNLFWSVLVIIAAVALAVSAMLLVRRGAPEGSRFTDGDRASGVFGVLGRNRKRSCSRSRSRPRSFSELR